MERVFVKKYAEFLTAYSDGKTIQCAIGDTGDWYDIEIEQIFDYVYPQLRIKPETKRVPLTKDDLVDRIKEGKTMWLSIDELILRFTDTHMHTSNGGIPYLFAFQHHYTFIDNSPCYKEVESE